MDALQPILINGLKHIPVPKDITDRHIHQSLYRFEQSTKWKIVHQQKELALREEDFNDDDLSRSYNPKLRPLTNIIPCRRIADNHSINTIFNNMRQEIHQYSLDNEASKHCSSEYKALLTFKRNHPLIIFKPADKNLGMTALTLEHYNALVLQHLNNAVNYTALCINTAEKLICVNRSLILFREFVGSRHAPGKFYFTMREKKYLNSWKDFVVPSFYILPKLHKPGPIKGRPIAGASHWITTPLSIILSERLKDHMLSLTHSLRNSQQLQEILSSAPPGHYLLASADVESLYPNVDLDLLYYIFDNNTDISHLTPLVRFICDNSLVEYNNTIYKQRKGIAMGTNAAVMLANIYMDWTTDRYIRTQLNQNHFILAEYMRYIDDLFFVVKTERLDQWPEFTRRLNRLSSLSFSCESPKPEIAFLDLNIIYDNDDKRFHTSIYQKELNKYLYIGPRSCHPKHTLSGFIKGELTRYARLSSSPFYYNFTKRLFYKRLKKRNYDNHFLSQIFRTHHWTDRYRRLETSKRKIMPLVLPYTKRRNAKMLEQIFYSYKDSLEHHLPQYLPTLVYTTGRSIKDILVSSKLSHEQREALAVTQTSRGHTHF